MFTFLRAADGARLDVAACGFWGGRHERAFFDVRVFNPHASSNNQPLSTCYRKHENAKKRAYDQRIREIEHGTFTPLVLSLTGGMGTAATVCYKRLASMIAQKRDQSYSKTMSWLRCSLSFSLLRSSIHRYITSRFRLPMNIPLLLCYTVHAYILNLLFKYS